MKKIIALLLALIMTFSVATVAFAEEVTEEPAEETILTDVEEFLGEYKWILDLPAGIISPALKLAKIALKFIKVYVKICNVFGLDPMETASGIFEYVAKIAEENEDLKNILDNINIPTTAAPEATA